MTLSLTAVRHLAVLCSLLVLLAPRPAAAGDPIVTTDLLRLRDVRSIDVAKNGLGAVMVVRSALERGPDDWITCTHLYHIALRNDDADVRQLTFGERRDAAPALAPDGRTIAFLRAGERTRGALPDEAGVGAPQLWLLSTAGGEARQITTLPHGVSALTWAPDGRRILLTVPVPMHEIDGTPPWPDEVARPDPDEDDDRVAAPAVGTPTARADGTRADIRAWLDANAADQDPSVITRLEFQGEHALRGPRRVRQLYVVDLTDDDPDATALTNDFFSHHDARYRPDGRAILFTSNRRTDVHPDRVLARSVWQMPVDGGTPTEILAAGAHTYRRPRPSSDGSVIAFLAQQTDDPGYRPWQLGIVSLSGDDTDPIWLTEPAQFDRSVWSFEWMPAHSSLVFQAPSRGGVPLYTMSVGLLEPATMVGEHDGLPVGVSAFGVGGATVVYAQHRVDAPCTVRVRDARGDREILDLNPWVAECDLARPERQELTRPDGTVVEYWMMKPTRFDPTAQYPLAVEIHGGPSAMWGPGEWTMWHEFQLLCSWGYGVMYANPRGSGGYGYDFESANRENWGNGPADDVLACVDEMLNREWVDSDRLAVTGGSYGGYLTAWIVSHDHRFKAAVAQRGVYDLNTFYGEGNAWRLVHEMMSGPPWDARVRNVLRRESPFTYVHRIRTPLLIMHASNDLRTGVSQSEMMYRALKDLGRPVEYVRYPDAGHDLSRSGDLKQRLDRLNRIIEFFDRFTLNSRPAPRRAE